VNTVLRKILGPKRDEVTGDWRRLHNEELYDLYPSPNIFWAIHSRMRLAGRVVRMGDSRGAYRVLVGRPEGKRPLGRPRCRLEDNIKMNLQEVGLGVMTWIDLAQGRDMWRTLVNAVLNFRVP
jgi:hypothetical protein